MTGTDTGVDAVTRVFRDAGVVGRLHAMDIDTGRDIGVGADDPVVLASVYKVPLLVAFFRQAAADVLDPTEAVTLRAADRSDGPTGVAILLDDVTMSLRDLAAFMITVSDNAAADAVFARTGADAVNAACAALGLTATRIDSDSRALHDSLLAESNSVGLADLWVRLAEPGMRERLSALDPARTNRSTPRDMTRLLRTIWHDEAAPPEECALMRRMLGLQVWPHRLAAGFPYDDIWVSGKTGTLPTIRNEIGVVEYPDGSRYAVAVFTRSTSLAALQPQADAAIGTAARLAVQQLRSA
ncbi:MAG: serine hydrolase [Streptomycetaceae bacterium]|nr:serine hydrolase [Streptomycetaceae bacterium]